MKAAQIGGLLVLVLAMACGGGNQGTQHTELPPANPEAVREMVAAVRLMNRGPRFHRRARTRLQRAIQIDPQLWEAHYNLGVLERAAGDLPAASAAFDAALAIDPNASEPLLAAAEVAYSRGDRSAAADRLQSLVQRDDAPLDARIALAVIYREDERWDGALEQAREVLVRDPSNVRALLEIGRVYRAREQHDVSRLVLDKALQLLEDDQAALRAQVMNERGLLELDRGDTQAAFEAFEGAVAVDASFKPARLNMGSVLLRAGDYAGAAAQYQAVLQTDDEDLDARVAYAIALRGQGEHRQARREYERVLRANPEHPDALFDLAVLRAEFLDQRPQSREQFQEFLRVAPRRHPARERAEQYLQEIPAPARPGAPAGS